MRRRCHSFFRHFSSSVGSKVAKDDLKTFEGILGVPNDVVIDPNSLQRYNEDWTRQYHGNAAVALRPSTTEQVSAILRYCNKRSLAVVPQGGNTGLVGGAVPETGEIVLCLEKMRRLLAYDEYAGIMTVEGGCILEEAEGWARDRGFIMPLDLGAKGSCTIGGNVATNAGGVRFLRYGSLHGNVTGLQVVLADGTILNDLHRCRKDNTGYDLKQLFIGSEGTLGVITAVSMLTPPLPASVNVALLMVAHFEIVPKIFQEARLRLGEIMSAFEFWDSGAHHLAVKYFPSSARVFPNKDEAFYVLVETYGSNSKHDQEKLLNFLEMLQQKGMIVNGTMAQDETQCKTLWSIRENLPEACAREGPVLKYDLSLSPELIYHPICMLKERLDANLVKGIVGFGHYGDGNIHVNIIARQSITEIESQLQPFIYEWVSEHQGSISAEHGIGLRKASYLKYARSPTEIAMMYRLKNLFDPKGILNPRKVLLTNPSK